MARDADRNLRRHERLARLSLANLMTQVFNIVRDSPELQAAGLDLSDGSYDDEIISLRGFAPDPAMASALLRDALGPDAADKVALEIIGPARTVVRDVPWESWTVDAEGTRVTVQRYDHTKGRGFKAVVVETTDDVTITLRGPRRAGLGPMIAIPVVRTVRLATPLAGRRVRDGADGRCPPQNDDFMQTDPGDSSRWRSPPPPG